MALPRKNNYLIDGEIVRIDVSTRKHANAIALIDIGDLDKVIDGKGRWYAWQANPLHTLYARRHVGGRKIYLHRILCPDSHLVDHRDRDGLNNRRSNLRPASDEENARNSRGQLTATSRYKGVFRAPSGKWMAQIKYKRRSRYLGTFDIEEAAARAYDREARAIFGEFALTNFPPEVA